MKIIDINPTSLLDAFPVCLKGGEAILRERKYWSYELEGAMFNWGMFSVDSSMTLDWSRRPSRRALGSVMCERERLCKIDVIKCRAI